MSIPSNERAIKSDDQPNRYMFP